MRIHHIACALGFWSVMVPALAQPGRVTLDGERYDVRGGHVYESPFVMVFAEPQLRGDVHFLIAPSGFQQPPNLVDILRRSTGCDWRPILVTPRVAQGTCRHMLPTANGSVHGVLKLAPLGTALRQAGARQINFSLAAQGESLGDGDEEDDWERGSTGQYGITGKITKVTNWSFSSFSDEDLPPDFEAQIGADWNFRRLLMPLALVLAVPFALALWVRRRLGSGSLWLHWILLGAWLYWITSIGMEDLVGFANALDTNHWVLALLLGTAVYCGPPLLACALCGWVLAPMLGGSQSWKTLRVALAAEAAFMAPLGVFLMGTALLSQEFKAGMLSILLAYGFYRLFTFCLWRWTLHDSTALVSGPLYDRAVELAKAAGVKLNLLSVVESNVPLEANAYASPGGRIGITRSLVENLSRREIDTILGHEIGHSRGNNSWWRVPMLLFYMFVAGPAIVRFATRAGIPAWVLDLPLIPLLYVMGTGWLSQKQELVADTRAARVTNDPEAAIAALSSLARFTKSPTDWKGIQGSILSHPSMKTRVLALAKQFGIARERALELLHRPEALYPEGAESERYPLPEWHAERQPVYGPPARSALFYWVNWVFGAPLIVLLVLVYAVALGRGMEMSGRVACLALSLPFVTIASLAISEWHTHEFIRKLRRKIEARRPPREGGIFVALLPGERVDHVGGIYAWDLGHLYLGEGYLTFEGERTQFSIAAGEIESIAVAVGPLAWFRTHAALVRSSSATFSLRLADRGASCRLAKQLVRRIAAWKESATATAAEIAPAQLPNLRRPKISRPLLIWHIAKKTALMAIGAGLTTHIAVGYAMASRVVPVAAGMIYLIVVFPAMLRRRA